MNSNINHPTDDMAPNLFIVGAPKCGTTALCHYLAEHPQVYISPAKEPHYHATDLPGLRYTTDYQRYLSLFSAATKEQFCRGEGSVYHLFSEAAVSNILKGNADARFVVMLRNPIDLVHALHGEHRAWLVEDVADFEEAWKLQPARRAGQHLPKHCHEPRVLQYAEVGALGSQLERLIKQVDPQRLKVIVFDDFANDTPRVYAETLTFLGLAPHPRTTFPRINPATRHRSRWLLWLTKRQKFPQWFTTFGRTIGLDKAYLRLRELNSYAAPRLPMSPSLRRELCTLFHPEVDRLSELLHRDLSHWCTLRPEEHHENNDNDTLCNGSPTDSYAVADIQGSPAASTSR